MISRVVEADVFECPVSTLLVTEIHFINVNYTVLMFFVTAESWNPFF